MGVLLLVIALPSIGKKKEKDSRHSEIDGEEAEPRRKNRTMPVIWNGGWKTFQLDGAGNVRVMVTLQSSARKLLGERYAGEKG